MTTGDECRPGPDGAGVPRVVRVSLLPTRADPVTRHVWVVWWPHEVHWDCCRRTDGESFGTWREAIAFALNRSWERP